jgi:hypothetical protein
MANELSVYTTFSYNKDSASFNLSAQNQVTVATNAFINSLVNVTTSDTAIDLGPVSSIGYVYIQNLDATNFVKVGPSSGSYFIKLLPKEVAVFRSNVSALHLIADTATCTVQYAVVSN